jgi:murein DD-endopeptidase MepM/ murein hydrolase activator NlpD
MGVTFADPLNSMSPTGAFGLREEPDGGGTTDHRGIDLKDSTKAYADVKASIQGTVVFAGYLNSRGNTVVIQSSENKKVFVVLQHLSTIEGALQNEPKVTPDTVIGVMGGTGRDPLYKVHLHYELIVSDEMLKNVQAGEEKLKGSQIDRNNAINPWILLPPQ